MFDLSAPILSQSWVRVKPCRHGLFAYDSEDPDVGKNLDLYGEFCESEVRLLTSLLKPGDLVIDAGANIGTLAIPLARHVGPQGCVYAFEPQSFASQLLNANAALNTLQNLVVHQTALGAAPGTARLPLVRPGSQNRAARVSLKKEIDGPTETIRIATVDSFNFSKCTLLKIDVEGMEQEVLTGAQATISKLRPILFVENNFKDLSQSLIQTLWDMGYTLYWFWTIHFDPNNYFNKPQEIMNMYDVNILAFPSEHNRSEPDGCVLISDPTENGVQAHKRVHNF